MKSYEAMTLDVFGRHNNLHVTAQNDKQATDCFNAIVENPSNPLGSWQVPALDLWGGEDRQRKNFARKKEIYGQK